MIRIELITGLLIFLCSAFIAQSNSFAQTMPPNRKEITIANRHLGDTISVGFFYTDRWYKKVIKQTRHLPEPVFDTTTTACKNCHILFKKQFFKSLLSLQSESGTDQCITAATAHVNDTAMSISEHLEGFVDGRKGPEKLTVYWKQQLHYFEFYAPRFAITYCTNNNENRKRYLLQADKILAME